MKLAQIIERKEFRTDRTPKGFRIGKIIRANELKRGMKVAAAYKQYNTGVDYIEILGISGNRQPYGEGGVHYNSVQDVFRAHRGIATLKQLYDNDNQNEYGYWHHLCARDLTDGRTGCWYYLNEKGRWCRGSGMEELSFRELHFVPRD